MFNENVKTKETLMILASVFLAVLVIFFGIKSYNEIGNRGNALDQQNTIMVTGKGEISVKPDIVEVSLSVQKEAVSVLNAQKLATESANKLVAFLKESGIEDKDIKTTNYSIYPRYDYIEKQGQVFRGYVVTQTLEVKIRKIEDAGEILGGATVAGANQVGGVNFTIDNKDEVQRQARQEAITDAKTRAEQLAKDLGVKIVRLISFSESGNGGIMTPSYLKSGVYGMGGDMESAVPVPGGENNVTASVNLIYEIK